MTENIKIVKIEGKEIAFDLNIPKDKVDWDWIQLAPSIQDTKDIEESIDSIQKISDKIKQLKEWKKLCKKRLYKKELKSLKQERKELRKNNPLFYVYDEESDGELLKKLEQAEELFNNLNSSSD